MIKQRLDLFLTKRHPYFSRTQIKKLIEEGFILVDGVQKKPSDWIHGGEKIEVKSRRPPTPKAAPEAIPLDILYEDNDLIILNKPAGLVIHPAPGNPTGTLLNALLYHSSWIGLVHRLDKGTSGVMVAAKNEAAQQNLSLQFKNRRVKKVYWALAFGRFAQREGTIRRSMGRDPQHRRKFSSRSRKLREAVTHYRVLKEYPGLTSVELRPETGRTHQIRVHLSEEHHPIVGDTTYGAKSFLSSLKDNWLRALVEGFPRPALHAAELTLSHPTKNELVHFAAPLAPDLAHLLKAIDAQ